MARIVALNIFSLSVGILLSATSFAQFPGVTCTNQRLAAAMQVSAPGGTSAATVSADGQFIAFESFSQDIVPSVQNGFIQDVFLYDRNLQITSALSVDPQGGPANGASSEPYISKSGTYVVFSSLATNLDSSSTDTNGTSDIFLSIPSAQVSVRVSTDAFGNQLSGIHFKPSVSDDGNRIVFLSTNDQIDPTDNNGKVDVFLKVLAGPGQGLHRLSRNGIPFGPHGSLNFDVQMAEISADGNAVIFSTMTNILGETNFSPDIFYIDISNLPQISNPIPVSHHWNNKNQAAGGAVWGSISADGKKVAFSSSSWDHVQGDINDQRDDVFIWNRDSIGLTKITPPAAPTIGFTPSYMPKISFNGRWIALLTYAYAWDPQVTREEKDTLLYDLETGFFEVLSRYSGGPGVDDEEVSMPTLNPGKTVSDNGKTSAFQTASNRVIPNYWSDSNQQIDVYISSCDMPDYPTVCSGDGTSTPCPGSTPGAAGCGCPNTRYAEGAKLEAIGFANLSDDRLKLRITKVPEGSPLVLVASFPNPQQPIQLGNGLKCLADPYYPTYVQTVPTGDCIDFGFGSPIYPSLGALVGVPFIPVMYQSFYLDMNYSGPNQPVNSTNALEFFWRP